MPSGGKRPKCPKRLSFRPSRTSHWIRTGSVRAAVAANLDRGVVLADAAYGINTEFRDGLTKLGLQYVVGVQGSMTIWEPGKQPLPAKSRGKMGRPPRSCSGPQPITPSPSSSWRPACPPLPSRKSLGGKAQTGSCGPALLPLAYVQLIGITRKRNLTRKNGC